MVLEEVVLTNILRIVLILLIGACIFDPADQLLGLKMPLFVLGWIIFIFDIILNGKDVYVPLKMLLYLILFIFVIPLTSIAYYSLTNGDLIKYDGYIYFKPYLFLTVVFILYVSKMDLFKPTIIMISMLSILTIIIFITSIFSDSFVQFLYLSIGAVPLDIGVRAYGGYAFPQIHFYTSPLILFAIGYYSLAVIDAKGSRRMLFGLFLAINVFAMFLGGTRNNIFVSVITPMLIACWYAKNKAIPISVILILSLIVFVNYIDLFVSMLDASETSNTYKLAFFEDYLNLFADSKILFFGQGLGSYFNTAMRGYVSVTELTYFEFVRRFGLILSFASFLLLLYPLSKLRLKQYHREHYIFISYVFYLVACFLQPLLMSSTGMLLFSLVLYKTFSSAMPVRCYMRERALC